MVNHNSKVSPSARCVSAVIVILKNIAISNKDYTHLSPPWLLHADGQVAKIVDALLKL
jgi:hypothetical protein